jgi:putative endonuclease
MNMPLPYCVYILFSGRDHLLYIGYSGNLGKRIETHNAGGNTSTAYRRPLKLIFCEFYLFEEDARKREMYFKTTMGKKAIKLMLAGTLEKLGYKKNTDRKIEMIFDSSDLERKTVE